MSIIHEFSNKVLSEKTYGKHIILVDENNFPRAIKVLPLTFPFELIYYDETYGPTFFKSFSESDDAYGLNWYKHQYKDKILEQARIQSKKLLDEIIRDYI